MIGRPARNGTRAFSCDRPVERLKWRTAHVSVSTRSLSQRLSEKAGFNVGQVSNLPE